MKLMAISSQIEDLGVGEERPLLKLLESSGNAAAVKVDFGAIEWQGGEGVPKKGVFIGQNGQGQI